MVVVVAVAARSVKLTWSEDREVQFPIATNPHRHFLAHTHTYTLLRYNKLLELSALQSAFIRSYINNPHIKRV